MKTEAEIRAHLVQKAEADSAFRAQLIEDPRGTVERELDITVPEGFRVHVHEDTATSAHLVLPPAGGRLSPGEMQAVSGARHSPDSQGQDHWTIGE